MEISLLFLLQMHLVLLICDTSILYFISFSLYSFIYLFSYLYTKIYYLLAIFEKLREILFWVPLPSLPTLCFISQLILKLAF